MVSRKQKKVWRYVEEGSLLKLKSYLRRNGKVEINFTQGKRRRGLLHLLCAEGEDLLLTLLLRHGADPLLKDRNGDTPLHLAVRRALKYGKRDYDDLVVPLCKHCPAALNTPNNAGVTPRDLLGELTFHQGNSSAASPQSVDPEQQWREKLFGECQDEFYETFGQYDADDFLQHDEDEGGFADWAEKIRREYEAKQRARASSGSTEKRRKRREEDEEEERKRGELHRRLEREHREYLERAARKRDETQQGRKRRYEERCDEIFVSASSTSSSSSSGMLGYDDVPWPAPRGSVDEMMAVILHGVDRSDAAAFRKFLRRQQTLWHPDKFAQRCGARLQDGDRQRIMGTVTALSQELNRVAQSLR